VEFTIVKHLSLSGKRTSIYSVRIEGNKETLFERFINENQNLEREALKEILTRLQTIGEDTGAREHYFKKEEGKPGDGIEALYDQEGSHLRLYCIRNGSVALILGGGGQKQGGAWQQYPKLKEENELLQLISQTFINALRNQDLAWSDDGMELLGDMMLSTDNY
jgi:regulator of replication initiation timing